MDGIGLKLERWIEHINSMNNEINLQNFSGKLPLFPLPNVVLFPNTLLHLHIFEKRYRRMLRDSLQGERMIGMAVLKPGWEEHYSGNPDIYPNACLGTILKHEPLADGKSNILLLGLKRVRIKDIISPRPYRTAAVEVMEDSAEGLSKLEARQLRREMLERYGEWVIEFAGSGRKHPTLSNARLGLGSLTDALAAGIGLPIEDLVRLLEEVRIGRRAQFLLKRMEEMIRRGGPVLSHEPLPTAFPHISLN